MAEGDPKSDDKVGVNPRTKRKAETKDEEATLLRKQPMVWNDGAKEKWDVTGYSSVREIAVKKM